MSPAHHLGSAPHSSSPELSPRPVFPHSLSSKAPLMCPEPSHRPSQECGKWRDIYGQHLYVLGPFKCFMNIHNYPMSYQYGYSSIFDENLELKESSSNFYHKIKGLQDGPGSECKLCT